MRLTPSSWSSSRGLRFEGVAIGGAALVLMGVIQRLTTDLPDCVALAPTASELDECLPWLDLQDGNELWPEHVRAMLAELGGRLGHAV